MTDLGGSSRLGPGCVRRIRHFAFQLLVICAGLSLTPCAGAATLPPDKSLRLGWLALRDTTLVQTDSSVDAALGPDGDLYVSGQTFRADIGTPLSFRPEPRDAVVWNTSHSMVARFAPDGTPKYIAYLGGSGPYNNTVYHLAVDSLGFAYVIGMADSLDFPVKNSTGNATPAYIDTYLTKISPDGSSVIYSTLLGGKALEVPGAVAVNGNGEAFVSGMTSSPDFPTLPSDPLCSTPARGTYAFVAKFSAEGHLLFSKRYGPEAGWTIIRAIPDASGGVLIVGNTTATNLPPGLAHRAASATNTSLDGFLAHFDAEGNATFSAYLGGDGTDSVTTVLQAPDGDLLVAAQSNSRDFSGTPAPFSGATNVIRATASVTRLSPDGRDIRWTHRVGTTENSTIQDMVWLPGGSLAALTTVALQQATEIDPVSQSVVLRIDPADGKVLSVTDVPSATRTALALSLRDDGRVRVDGTAVSGVAQSVSQRSMDPVLCDITLNEPGADLAPSVRWVSPNLSVPGTRSPIAAQNVLPVKLNVQDWAGSLWQVQLYDGNVLLGSWNQPPFTVSWTNPPVGIHSLRAILTDQNRVIRGGLRRWTFAQDYLVQDSAMQDRFAARVQISPDGQTLIGSLLGCTPAPPPASSLETCGNSAWFAWSPNQDMTVQCQIASIATPTGQGLNLEVYEGDSVNALTLVTSAAANPPSTQANFQARAGHSYSIHIAALAPTTKANYSVDSGLGLFRLSLGSGFAPVNDRRDAAIVLNGAEVLTRGTTEGATLEPSDGSFSPAQISSTVWYSWSPSQSGPVEVLATPERTGPFAVKVLQDDGTTVTDQTASGGRGPRSSTRSRAGPMQSRSEAGHRAPHSPCGFYPA